MKPQQKTPKEHLWGLLWTDHLPHLLPHRLNPVKNEWGQSRFFLKSNPEELAPFV